MNFARIPALDGIRAIAVLLVMWYHSYAFGMFPGGVGSSVKTIGQTGVDLFFVLSGFLITRILIREKGKSGYYKSFYIKRSLRILPLYYIFLVLYLSVHGAWGQEGAWWAFVFLQNIPLAFGDAYSGPVHYWSLGVEEHFYLIWPFLICLINPRRMWVLGFFGILLSIVLRVVFVNYDYGYFYFSITRLDGLCMGAWLALYEGHVVAERRRFRTVFASAACLILVPLALVYGAFRDGGHAWLQVSKFTLVSMFYTCCVGYAICLDFKSWPARILSWRPLVFIGGVSYGLYIYHQLWFELVMQMQLSAPISVLYGWGGSLLLACLSFYYMEKPMMSLRKRFSNKGKYESSVCTSC